MLTNFYDSTFLFSGAVVERLGWVLVHSLWQLAALAMLAWMVERLLGQASAAWRYRALLAFLLLMAAVPVVTWTMLGGSSQEKQAAPPAVIAQQEKPSSEIASPQINSPPIPMPTIEGSAANVARVASVTELTWTERGVVTLRPWLKTVVAIWCMGVLVCSLRPIWGWMHVRRLRTVGTTPVTSSIQQLLQTVAERLQVTRRIEMLASSLVTSPVVVGCFRSVILLPTSFITAIPLPQLEAILAHELAHVRRYDYLVNLLQTLAETIYFYHPAVWWLSYRIRVEREHCCDDLVVASMNNRVEYGRALLSIEEHRTRLATTSLALNANGGSLLARVKRLFADPASEHRRGGVGWISFATLAMCTVFAVALSGLIADESKDADNSAKTDAATEKSFTAQITDSLSVELIAIYEHSVGPEKSWRANGSEFTETPPVPKWAYEVPRFSDTSRHLFFQWMGRNPQQSVACRIPGLEFYGSIEESEMTRLIAKMPDDRGVSARVGVTDVEWGPWQKVDRQGKTLDAVEIPAACRDVYDRIGADHVRDFGNACHFCWSGLKGVDDTCQVSIVAVDLNGKRHTPDASTFTGDPPDPLVTDIFNLPQNEIDHFEYRLRPYRHWVTFENVSLQRGKTTEVKISVETVPVAVVKDDAADVEPILKPLHDKTLPDSGNVLSVGFAAESKLWSVATYHKVNVRSWNVESGEKLSDVELETELHGNRFIQSQLQFSPDRSRVFGIIDGKIGIWDSTTGKLVTQLEAANGLHPHRGLSCSADFSLIACGMGNGGRSNDAQTVIWNVSNGQMLTTVRHENAVQIQSTALSSDGRWLATGSQDNGLCLWDAESGELLHHISNENEDRSHPDKEVERKGASQVLGLCYSPDGTRLAMSDMLSLKIFDSKTGKLLHDFDSPYRYGRCSLVFSANGTLLARTGTDKAIPMWNTQSGTLIAELPSESYMGSFSSDGQMFAAGFSDDGGGVRVWKLPAK